MNKLLVVVFSLTCALSLLPVNADTKSLQTNASTNETVSPEHIVIRKSNVGAFKPTLPPLRLASSLDQWETHEVEKRIKEDGGVPWGCEDFSVTVKRFVNRHAFLTTVIIVVPMVLVGLIILVPLLILRALVNKRFGKN